MIELANRQADLMFGYPSGGMIGVQVEQLVPARVRRFHPQLRSAFAAHPEMRQMGHGRELSAVRYNGTEFRGARVRVWSPLVRQCGGGDGSSWWVA